MTMRSTALRIWHWRHTLSLRQLIIGGVFLLPLVIGGLLALRMLHPAATETILPGQGLAGDIARAAAFTKGVQIASGAYLPGDKLILYTRTNQTDRAHIRSWAFAQLAPFSDRLLALPEQETLTWVIDFGPPPGEQEAITVPLHRVADPAYYRYVSGHPRLSAVAEAAPTAVPQSPTVAVQPQPTEIAVSQQPLGQLEQGDLSSIWTTLSGDWHLQDGIYSQVNTARYDSISMLNMAPHMYYRFEVKLRLGAGEMGGGLIYNAPEQTKRNGAYSIDFDNQGGFLRWGHYDADGTYIYDGGIKLDKPINDREWHTLRLETGSGSNVVSLDGREMGVITSTNPQGYLGLIASKTEVDFRDISVTLLPTTESGTK